jgi:hypothetical protein
MVRQESLVKEEVVSIGTETLSWDPASSQSRPTKARHRSEASCATSLIMTAFLIKIR